MSGILTESSHLPFLSLPSNLSTASASLSDDASEHYQVINEGKLKKFICGFQGCQKTFRFKSEIERHLSAHSGLRPHECTYPGCKKSFKRIDALDDHVRSQHTGEAPLICPYNDCGQRFSTTAKLRYHSALHEDQKPYKCSVDGCDRGFVTLSQLRQHEKSTLAHRKFGLTPDRKRSNFTNISQSPAATFYQSETEDAPLESMTTANKKRVKYDTVYPSHQLDSLFFSDHGIPSHIIHESHDDFSKASREFSYENIKLDEPVVEKKEYLTNVLDENEVLKKRLNYTENMIHAMKGQLDKVMLLIPNQFDHMKLLGYKQEATNPIFDSGNHHLGEGLMPEVDNFFFLE